MTNAEGTPVNSTPAANRRDCKILGGRALLLVIIAAGVSLRFLGLGWGIPRAIAPESTACRNSFHLDEDDYIWGLTRMKPREWNYDVRDYHWGTLQFYLVAGALETGRFIGYFTRPWRESFLNWDPKNFSRVYIAGRALSACIGVLSLPVVFFLGKRLRNTETGLMAAAFLAVAPLHVVNSHFLTSDVTMVFLLLGAVHFFIISLQGAGAQSRIAGGFLLGLAISAKYNAAFLAPLWIAGDSIRREIPWKSKMLAYIAMFAGFAAGEPYAFVHPGDFLGTVYREFFQSTNSLNAVVLPWPRLLFRQAEYTLRFGLQWTLAIPAAVGLIICLCRPSKERLALAGSMILMASSLVAARWPMHRYALPVIALAAVAAALFIAGLPISRTWRARIAALLCSLPLLVSWAQVEILLNEHTANSASDWIYTHIEPGSRIGQIWPEVPPLDGRRYQLRALHGIFPQDPAAPEDLNRDYLILDNLPIQEFSGDFITRLAQDYVPLAEFRSDAHVGPWVLNEDGAPHDWKYSHPVLRIYGRKPGRETGVSPQSRSANPEPRQGQPRGSS